MQLRASSTAWLNHGVPALGMETSSSRHPYIGQCIHAFSSIHALPLAKSDHLLCINISHWASYSLLLSVCGQLGERQTPNMVLLIHPTGSLFAAASGLLAARCYWVQPLKSKTAGVCLHGACNTICLRCMSSLSLISCKTMLWPESDGILRVAQVMTISSIAAGCSMGPCFTTCLHEKAQVKSILHCSLMLCKRRAVDICCRCCPIFLRFLVALLLGECFAALYLGCSFKVYIVYSHSSSAHNLQLPIGCLKYSSGDL